MQVYFLTDSADAKIALAVFIRLKKTAFAAFSKIYYESHALIPILYGGYYRISAAFT